MNTKICSQCNTEKKIIEFNKDKTSKSGYRSYCKSCRSEQYSRNKDHYNSKNLEWRLNNHEKHRKYCREYEKTKRLNDPSFKIAKSIRCRVRKILLGTRKYKSTLDLLGCSFEELKLHLELQFTSGMSWNNYGEWHIDHIRPCASFDLSNIEDQKICFNYKNLQPLWAEDNLRKGAKIIDN